MPEGYLDRPEMPPESTFLWDAFWALSTDRAVGFGVGPIPFSSLDRYAQRYGIDDIDAFDEFRRIIRKLDSEYLTLRAPKPQDQPQNKEKPV